MDQNLNPTKLEYYDHMFKLQSTATLLSCLESFSLFPMELLDAQVPIVSVLFWDEHEHTSHALAHVAIVLLDAHVSLLKGAEDDTLTLILDSTIFHPQGGGQPSDTGFITNPNFRFKVQDVRSKDKIVFHYGFFEDSEDGVLNLDLLQAAEVSLHVDESRRKLNSRLHSAGHLLDVCMSKIGLGHLEPTKGYHFPDGPFVEYKGTVPQSVLESKQKELELEANNLISSGGNVSVSIVSYDTARELCGGCLPDYIAKDSAPRIVKLGENPGCPCGGTHVSDISEIVSLKVSQIRPKKGMTKVFYSVGS